MDAPRLAAVMQAFANPVRIEVLRQLRTPKTLGEIRVVPARRGGGQAGRFINRVTVRQHLARLMAVGAVRQTRTSHGGRYLDTYVVDHRQLFTIAEELHRMGRIRPVAGPIDGTAPFAPAGPSLPQEGARVVLVNGTYEGTVFPLGAPGRESWAIGRRRASAICLDYDPYVSLDHATILAQGGCYHVRDAASARNRTQVNWRPLEPGAQHALATGDVVGVGRSLLLFLDSGRGAE